VTPENVAFPTIGGLGPPEKKIDSVGKAVWGFGPSQKPHASLFGGSIPLFPVASNATGDDVLPTLISSSSHWNNMIIGEVARRELAPTILTAMTIPGVNVASRKLHLMVVPLDLHIAQQAKDRRQGKGEGDTADFSIVFCQDLNLVLEEHTQSTLPRNHVQGLVG